MTLTGDAPIKGRGVSFCVSARVLGGERAHDFLDPEAVGPFGAADGHDGAAGCVRPRAHHRVAVRKSFSRFRIAAAEHP